MLYSSKFIRPCPTPTSRSSAGCTSPKPGRVSSTPSCALAAGQPRIDDERRRRDHALHLQAQKHASVVSSHVNNDVVSIARVSLPGRRAYSITVNTPVASLNPLVIQHVVYVRLLLSTNATYRLARITAPSLLNTLVPTPSRVLHAAPRVRLTVICCMS